MLEACDPAWVDGDLRAELLKSLGQISWYERDFDGGYAEYAVVPAESVARIPDGLDPKEAGPLLCAGVTTYNSMRNSGARPGDTVAVQGIGGLGHLALQFAARMGATTVEIPSSHVPMVSHPAEAADLIMTAADALAARN